MEGGGVRVGEADGGGEGMPLDGKQLLTAGKRCF